MKKIINLTPHKIGVKIGDVIYDIPPSGTVARCNTVEEPKGSLAVEINGTNTVVPLVGVQYSTPEVPPPQEGVIYIVSQLVFQNTNRHDVVVPDTGKTCVRDSNGNIVAVTRFISK